MCVCVCALRKYTVIVLDVWLVNTLYVHGIKGGKLLLKCCNKFNGIEMSGFHKRGADWRSG